LHGTTDIPERQMEAITKQYFSFIDPDYIKIIVDENNEVVAFGIAMPSFPKRFKKRTGGSSVWLYPGSESSEEE
jgi:hypothetical protein